MHTYNSCGFQLNFWFEFAALKRSLVYREELSSGEFGREMAAECNMQLAKCASIDCRVADLLLGLSREFCTAESVSDVTVGILADPAFEPLRI